MRRVILVLLVAVVSVSYAAPLKVPSRQVTVRTDNLSTISQVPGAYAPTGSLQAHLEWMDDNWIGHETNKSYYYLDSTSQSFYDATVRHDLDVQNNVTVTGTVTAAEAITGDDVISVDDVIVGDDLVVTDDASVGGSLSVTGGLTVVGSASLGDLTFTGDFLNESNDMAVSFMGYPKVSLTTNMVTVVDNGGTIITIDSFANAFDADFTTVTSTGVLGNAENQRYIVDLGANYAGWFRLKMWGETDAGGNLTVKPVCTYTDNMSETSPPQYYDGTLAAGGNYSNTMAWTAFSIGRYLAIRVSGGTANEDFGIYDWSFYGTTNGFRNMGGF